MATIAATPAIRLVFVMVDTRLIEVNQPTLLRAACCCLLFGVPCCSGDLMQVGFLFPDVTVVVADVTAASPSALVVVVVKEC